MRCPACEWTFVHACVQAYGVRACVRLICVTCVRACMENERVSGGAMRAEAAMGEARGAVSVTASGHAVPLVLPRTIGEKQKKNSGHKTIPIRISFGHIFVATIHYLFFFRLCCSSHKLNLPFQVPFGFWESSARFSFFMPSPRTWLAHV